MTPDRKEAKRQLLHQARILLTTLDSMAEARQPLVDEEHHAIIALLASIVRGDKRSVSGRSLTNFFLNSKQELKSIPKTNLPTSVDT